MQEAKVCHVPGAKANGAASEDSDAEDLDDFMDGDNSIEFHGSF